MSNNTPATQQLSIKQYFKQPAVEKKFRELIGAKAPGFMTSVLQAVAANPMLSKADPASIYNSAAVAAVLDLPINNSIGHAYIVPYNQKQKDGSYLPVAQFQIGWKGFKQLALRTGQFSLMNETDVREGEIKSRNRMTGEIEFQWIEDDTERNKKPIIGYLSYFKLVNGFENTFFMTKEQVMDHAKKYSQVFKKNQGPWKDDFDGMAIKTVVKLNLNKNAPLSTEMQKAITVDQSVIKDESGENVEYVDHEEVKVDVELERFLEHLGKCNNLDEIDMLLTSFDGELSPEMSEKVEAKKKEVGK